MEKLGYSWSGGRTTRTRPNLSFRTVDEVGRPSFTALVGRAGAHGLDREMAHYQAHTDIRHWAAEHVRYLGEREDLLAIGYVDDEPIGLVALEGLEDSDHDCLLTYVAVVPEHRGNGYVNDLLGHGVRMAIDEGWNSVRSETDMINLPTRNAFIRNGFTIEPASRAWGHMLDIRTLR